MKNGGGWSDLLLYGCAEMVRSLGCEHLSLVAAAFGVG